MCCAAFMVTFVVNISLHPPRGFVQVTGSSENTFSLMLVSFIGKPNACKLFLASALMCWLTSVFVCILLLCGVPLKSKTTNHNADLINSHNSHVYISHPFRLFCHQRCHNSIHEWRTRYPRLESSK